MIELPFTLSAVDNRELITRRQYFEGDHYQDGKGWIGPTASADPQVKNLTAEAIKKIFTSRNLVRKACLRHRDAVVGDEVRWSYGPIRPLADDEKPTAAEQALINDAYNLMVDWWDTEGIPLELQDAVATLQWAGGEEAVSPVRLYYSDGLRFAALDPASAGMLHDLDGRPYLGYYRYKNDLEQDETEITLLGRNVEKVDGLAEHLNRAVPGFTYKPNDTLLIIISDRTSTTGTTAVAYPLGGQLLIYEMRREPLITKNALELQKSYNLAMTMMVNNLISAGFLETVLTNADLPGDWYLNDVKLPKWETGAEFRARPYYRGAGTLNAILGKEVYDNDNQLRGYATPGVHWRDPAPVSTFEDAMNLIEFAFYDEVSQLHTLISGDATASGRSRIQATNDFVASLGVTAAAVERCVRWLMTTALRFRAFLDGRTGRYDSLRVTAKARISAVQPAPEERAAFMDEAERGFRSRASAMEGIGIDDVDAELARMALETPPEPTNEPQVAEEPEVV